MSDQGHSFEAREDNHAYSYADHEDAHIVVNVIFFIIGRHKVLIVIDRSQNQIQQIENKHQKVDEVPIVILVSFVPILPELQNFESKEYDLENHATKSESIFHPKVRNPFSFSHE